MIGKATLFNLNGFACDNIEEALSKNQSIPCGDLVKKTIGWSPALGGDTSALSHQVDNKVMMRMQINEKIIPSEVLKKEVKKLTDNFIRTNDRKPNRSEKNKIKSDAEFNLIPKAFEKTSYVIGYLNKSNGTLVVCESSNSKVDDFTALLRKSNGSLAIDPLCGDITEKLTLALESATPGPFCFGFNAKLQDEEGSAANFKNQELDLDEVKQHLKCGKKVKTLGLSSNQADFSLNHDGKITSIKYIGIDMEKGEEPESVESNFALCSGVVSKVFESITDFIE